jgi:hypothetical protein
MEREACLQGILHISQKPHLLGSPVKEPSLKVPFMESLAERCLVVVVVVAVAAVVVIVTAEAVVVFWRNLVLKHRIYLTLRW